MEYFGTNLTECGHYRWNLDRGGLYGSLLRIEDLPFHPEGIVGNLQNGEVVFYQGGGYTVLGIAGSCKDTRPGSKSIFWVKEIITKEEIINRVNLNKVAKQIIDKLPFKVKW